MKGRRSVKKAIGIVGEGLTERMYFDYIRRSRRYSFTLKPDLPGHSDYVHIFKKAKQLLQKGFDLVFCVVDIDTILNNGMIDRFASECKHLPKNIIPVTSNPCIEFWFLLHFLKKPKSRVYESCQRLIEDSLHTYVPSYEKTEAYFRTSHLFTLMEEKNGLEKALENAKHILEKLYATKDPSCCSFSEISLLISQLEKCKQCDFKADCKNCASTFPAFFINHNLF